MSPPHPALIVFAKTPQPGKVKTRLAQRLGDELAVEAYRCFVADMVERLAHLPATRLIVYQAPAVSDREGERARLEALLPWASEFAWQQGADLGERMGRAIGETLAQGAAKVVIVGADHPTMPSEAIAEALAALDAHDVVFGPATDGGCYLVGARRPCEQAFAGVEWGTSRVLAQCLERAEAAGLSVALLAEHRDVDDVADLRLLRHDLLAMGEQAAHALCPRTWEFLQRDNVVALVGPETTV